MSTLTADHAATDRVVEAVRSCPACSGRHVEVVHRLALRTPDGHPMGNGYEVVSCRRCGMGFANLDPPLRYYDEYYTSAAKYATEHRTTRPTAAPDREPDWVLERFDQLADRLATQLPRRSARILDIGCANGTLLAGMKAKGHDNVFGLDPSPESATLARQLHGIHVETGTFSTMPRLGQEFDCICMTGVLEHLWDVDEALTTVLSLLSPGGVVFVEVPDASRYDNPFIAPFQDFSTEHVNHFSPATLDRLGRRFGLTTLASAPSDCHVAEGARCAALTVVWGRRGAPDAPEPPRDLAVVDSLRAFTDRSAAEFAGVEAQLQRQLADWDRYVVWGFGEMTMKLLALRPLRARRLLGIIDSNPSRQGFRYGDVRVQPPESDLPPDAPVVIGSLLSGEAIARHLTQLGLPNPVVRLTDR